MGFQKESCHERRAAQFLSKLKASSSVGSIVPDPAYVPSSSPLAIGSDVPRSFTGSRAYPAPRAFPNHFVKPIGKQALRAERFQPNK